MDQPVGLGDQDLGRVLLQVVHVLPVQTGQDLRRVRQKLSQAVHARLGVERELLGKLAETLRKFN